MSFPTWLWFFCKNQKNFKFGKMTKFDEKRVLKNAFILLKGILSRIGWWKICRFILQVEVPDNDSGNFLLFPNVVFTIVSMKTKKLFWGNSRKKNYAEKKGITYYQLDHAVPKICFFFWKNEWVSGQSKKENLSQSEKKDIITSFFSTKHC